MKKKSIQQIFISFLKGEGVFDAYIKNFENKHFAPRPIKDRSDYLLLAFSWHRAPEDHYFWDKIDKKWQKLISDLDKKNNPGNYHTRCHDCGQFIKRDLWIKKDSSDKFHAHCSECLSYYD